MIRLMSFLNAKDRDFYYKNVWIPFINIFFEAFTSRPISILHFLQ
jgi:hypothetical protein